MTHDKPEPPDMRGDAVTLRQKIQDEIKDVSDREKENGLDPDLGPWFDGQIEALKKVLGWIDEQEAET